MSDLTFVQVPRPEERHKFDALFAALTNAAKTNDAVFVKMVDKDISLTHNAISNRARVIGMNLRRKKEGHGVTFWLVPMAARRVA